VHYFTHDNQLIEHFEYKTNKLFVLSPGALGGQKLFTLREAYEENRLDELISEYFFFDKKIQTAFF